MPLSGEYEPSTIDWVREQVERYEASGGTEATTLRDTGMPVVVVTSVGAKSGKLRKNPLMRVEHEGRYAAVASMGGQPTHPVWYYNLLAHPQVELQDGETGHGRARGHRQREGRMVGAGGGGVPAVRRLPAAHATRDTGLRARADRGRRNQHTAVNLGRRTRSFLAGVVVTGADVSCAGCDVAFANHSASLPA
jgi:deazaflavin-dependent oxidoreductase (nitroreductase family)